MKARQYLRHALAALAVAMGLTATVAQAAVIPPNQVQLVVSDIANYDERGAASNVIREIHIGAHARITSLAWNVNVTSHAGSYLSEMKLTFGDSAGNGITFTPGDGDDMDGTMDYAGFQDFDVLGLSFALLDDGILRLEFHDGYKDLAFDEPEGMWNSGTLTFGVTPVPEPSSFALLLGGLAVLALRAARHRRKAVLAIGCWLWAGLASAGATFEAAKPLALYSYFVTGNAEAPVSAPGSRPDPSFVLMGGGPDVDAAFRWLIQRAGITPASGGRFVVLRASGSADYNPYIYYSDEAGSTSAQVADTWVGGAALGLTSVETLVIPSVKAANHPAVNEIVARANVVFIAGGDQSHYIRFWKGTALEGTLNRLIASNVPIGGTSAGLAVLGQFDYSALYKSATSEAALLDPYNKDITFDPAPLSLQGGFIAPPALAGLLFDSHFDSRDRMGRMMAFLARLVAPTATSGGTYGCSGGVLPASASGKLTARGIGLGVETALLVQGNGAGRPVTATRVSNPSTTTESAVYFVRPAVPPTVCQPKTPLTMSTVEVRKLADSQTVFNLSDWSGVPLYRHLDVNAGQLFPAHWY